MPVMVKNRSRVLLSHKMELNYTLVSPVAPFWILTRWSSASWLSKLDVASTQPVSTRWVLTVSIWLRALNAAPPISTISPTQSPSLRHLKPLTCKLQATTQRRWSQAKCQPAVEVELFRTLSASCTIWVHLCLTMVMSSLLQDSEMQISTNQRSRSATSTTILSSLSPIRATIMHAQLMASRQSSELLSTSLLSEQEKLNIILP